MNTLVSIIRTSTFKDSGILFIGVIASTFLGFVFTAILFHNIPTEQFGLFISAMTFTQLLVDLFELGINSSVLNFLSGANEEVKLVYLKTTFIFKIILSLTVGGVVFIFAPVLSKLIFNSLLMEPFIRISSFGVTLLMILTWQQTVFQAEKKFIWSMITNTSTNVSRLIVLFILIALNQMSVITIYFLIQVILAISVIGVLPIINLNLLKINKKLPYKEVAKFSLPIGLSFATNAVYSRLDQILILNMAGGFEAGIYGLAYRIASALVFGTMAFNSSITPKISSMHQKDFPQYFKKTIWATLGLAGLSVLAIPAAFVFIPLIFGIKSINAIFPFQLLVVGMIFFMLSSPINTAILYRYKKTRYPLVLSICSLMLIWILLQILVPNFRSAGAALAVTIVNFVQFIITAAYFYRLTRKEEK